MQSYPQNVKADVGSLLNAVQDISRKREQDITDRNTFNSIFVRGRTVGKVPSGSADVVSTDRIGDRNFDANYGYILVLADPLDPTSAAWRRWALSSW